MATATRARSPAVDRGAHGGPSASRVIDRMKWILLVLLVAVVVCCLVMLMLRRQRKEQALRPLLTAPSAAANRPHEASAASRG